jgi:phosphoglycolate phosphatase-like HAD superfamily hydrolase
MKALVLDFDGVISNSAPEAFLVAVRTYADLRPASDLSAAVADLVRNPDVTLTDVQNSSHYARFLELMPFGNRAEDYAVILSILECKLRVDDQHAYDRVRSALSGQFLQRFHDHFYAVRRAFFARDPVAWRRLIAPYTPVLAWLKRRATDALLAIATAKDGSSVRVLLEDYELIDLFAEERILDKDVGVTKAAHLQHLHQTLGIAYAAMTFLDDKVNHLDAVAPLGVRCALATWGYNGPREHRLARQRGYLVCALEDAESKLFGTSDFPDSAPAGGGRAPAAGTSSG